ncbi:conserved hypothetical protein [Candidatus Sulfopaludibacter sp. SbA3]|nr:conserved hypothetical protein [Candidatus Sulfopaludibacter sp. SbA3]
MDHFEFGGSFRNGFSLDGEIHARTAGDAKKVAEWLKFFETMTGSQQNAANGTKFSVHTEDGTLKLSLRIPEEELKKAIAAQKASMAAAVKAQAQPQPKPDPHGKIVTNAAGDTVSVTLPGGHW